jgi:hypothetical protein
MIEKIKINSIVKITQYLRILTLAPTKTILDLLNSLKPRFPLPGFDYISILIDF